MTSLFIEPQWPAPPGVFALSTLRRGGVSTTPYDSFNLGDHVGDVPDNVCENRRRLLQQMPASNQVQWLNQVHGVGVVEAGADSGIPADACFSGAPGIACAVLTADCLPVLFCSADGKVVAAAHAGWRGLCAGVLEATVANLEARPRGVLAWLGPAIGPGAFEVGPEVREQFLERAGPHSSTVRACFTPSELQAGHFMADIYALARQRLAALGLERVYGGGECTFTQAQRYFSYRRDGQTGRMATLIMLTDTLNPHLK